MGSGFEPQAPHQFGHCTNRIFDGRGPRGCLARRNLRLIRCCLLGYAEDRDYPPWVDDFDLGDEYLDEGLPLAVGAGRDDGADVIGDLPQGGGWRCGGCCADLAGEFVSAGAQLC